MDIRLELISEHSRRQTMAIVEYIGDDKYRFAELMSIFFEGEYRLTQRAAWPISFCAERRPELIGPYLEKLVDQLPRTDIHDAVKRNVVRLLQNVEIPKKLLGKVYSHSLDLIDEINEPVAVRAFALTVFSESLKPWLRRIFRMRRRPFINVRERSCPNHEKDHSHRLGRRG